MNQWDSTFHEGVVKQVAVLNQRRTSGLALVLRVHHEAHHIGWHAQNCGERAQSSLEMGTIRRKNGAIHAANDVP